MKNIVTSIFLLFHLSIFAQVGFDSAAFNNYFVFNNGIYTSLEELKYNSPRYPNCELELEKGQETIYMDKLHYINSRQTRLKYESYLYATVVDGHLSIYYNDQLNAVFLKGAISTFILKEIVTTAQYQSQNNMGLGYPGYGSPGYSQTTPVTTSHLEVNIYFLDFETGTILKVDKDNLAPIIQRDSVLYESFKKIKGDSNNKKSYPYISQYNSQHTVYIKVVSLSPTLDE